MRVKTAVGVVVLVLLGVAGVHAQPAKGAPKKKPKTISAEVTALGGPDLELAARAAQTLGTYDLPAAHEALLDALAFGLAPDVAVPALLAVAARPAAPDIGALRRYAGHRNPTVRSAALSALATYGNAGPTIVAGLKDPVATVRAAAAAAAGKGKMRDAIDPLLLLLAKGEDAAGRALAAIADLDLARKIADQFGKVPDPVLAVCLGAILKRPDFADPARVEIVRAIGKIQDPAAITALTDYLDSTPKTPKRTSLDEAQMIVDARSGK
jgi:HEAT repeat protein